VVAKCSILSFKALVQIGRSMTADGHHEFGAEHAKVELPSNRSFGMVFTVAFAIYAAYLARHGTILWIASGIAALVFAVAGVRDAAWLTPLNRLWMRVGLLLGVIIAPVALAILFFVIITPIGLMAQAFGKDFLRIKRDNSKSSYWIYRDSPGPDAKSMNRQF
jgi:hypothetical protein